MHPSFAVFAALLAIVGGQAIPLSTLEQAEFLTEHNKIRARTGSQNMECFTEWSTSLATAAAAQAARCNLTAPTNDANGYFFHSSSDRLTPAEILEQIWTTHTIAYEYLQNNCDNNLATDNECANVRQVLWYEGGEIGCAKHQCATPSAIITVCAYTARAVPHSRPYALVPNFQPCTLCRSSFPVCRSQLCCKSTTTTAIPLSTLEQAEFLTQHNIIRARTGSQNMECFTEWSTSLASAAAAQAARCNLTAPTNDANGYFFHSSSHHLTPAEILEQIWQSYIIAYDYLQNKCDNNLTTDNECANVRQMLWHEGGEIGCAKHQCATPSTIITVCAYRARAVPHSRPYALIPNFPPCTICRSSFPVCRSQLCCKSTTTVTPSPQPPQPGNTPAGKNERTLTTFQASSWKRDSGEKISKPKPSDRLKLLTFMR
uniref:SCP domain-containing protein n=1 Tax=Trichuris muris TaxID=70415 RepID=A0A5S6QGN0_TRIMR